MERQRNGNPETNQPNAKRKTPLTSGTLERANLPTQCRQPFPQHTQKGEYMPRPIQRKPKISNRNSAPGRDMSIKCVTLCNSMIEKKRMEQYKMKYSPLSSQEVIDVINGKKAAPRVPIFVHMWVHPDTFGDREDAVREMLKRYPSDISTRHIAGRTSMNRKATVSWAWMKL
ncbi:MAG: hypothetical protein NT018_13785 [Armatimonadetes bacterium]|nr:hypothetical protein [Armatimonadota bacterium]